MDDDFRFLLKLSEQLSYNPNTGLFVWKVAKQKVKAGSIAGSWRKVGYVGILFEGKAYLAHRLAWLFMYGEFPPEMVDHINGDKSDNRIDNLRAATRSQNNRNSKVSRLSRHGIKGARWDAKGKRWVASAAHLGNRKYLGSFKTSEEAQQAYIDFVNRVEPGFCRV